MTYAITGITGQVGGAVGRALLAAGRSVRAVVRDAGKGAVRAERGCAVALAAIDDPQALAVAFQRAEGVFVLLPSSFDPAPGFPEVRRTVAAVQSALEAVRPDRVVCLSTIGAQSTRPNLLGQLSLMEELLGGLPMPVAFLRPARFMVNCAWDIAPAREAGVVSSFLQPLDKPLPMVATADVGRRAAALLQETWSGRRIVQLEGPRRVTPNEIAATLSRLLGRAVQMEAVPHATWENLFRSQGMKNPIPRIRMLDGFNEGWSEFEGGEAGSLKGETDLKTVLRGLVSSTA